MDKTTLGYEFLKGLYLKKHSAYEVNTDLCISDVLERLQKGEVMRSERVNKAFQGILYNLIAPEKEKVAEIEKQYNAKVIHILHTHMEYGDEYAYVLAPTDEEDLAYQLDDILPDGSVRAYAVVSNDFCTEYGSIGIKTVNGGFTRTY